MLIPKEPLQNRRQKTLLLLPNELGQRHTLDTDC